MQTGKLDRDLFSNGSSQLGKVLTTTVSGVTVTITVTGEYGTGNGTVTSTSTGGQSKALRFYDRENKSGTSQTILITFSKQVQNVRFSLLDVDSQTDRPTNAYEDTVVVNTPGWVGAKHSNVKGSGTAKDPYRGKNQQPGGRLEPEQQRRPDLVRQAEQRELHLRPGRRRERRTVHRHLRPVLRHRLLTRHVAWPVGS